MQFQQSLLTRKARLLALRWQIWASPILAFLRLHVLTPMGQALGGLTTGLHWAPAWGLPAISSIGAYHTLSGATTVTYNPNIKATNDTYTLDLGESVTLGIVINSTEHGSPKSYSVRGDVPAGVTPQEGSVINSNVLVFTGVPTEGGTFNVEVKGWKARNASSGNNSSPWYSFEIRVNGAPAPTITQQPAATTVPWGGTAEFTAEASDARNLQWRRNGIALNDSATVIGTETPKLTLTKLTSIDDGAIFDLVASGEGSPATSNPAPLTVESTDYDRWRESTFTDSTRFNDAVSGPLIDFDRDGRDNLMEFVLRSDPFEVDPRNPFTASIAGASNDRHLRLEIVRNPELVETQMIFELLTDPANNTWTAVPNADILIEEGIWAVRLPLAAKTSSIFRARAVEQ